MRRQEPVPADEGYARYEAYSKLLDRNGRWVEVADTKAAVILGFVIATFPALMAPALPAARRLVAAVPPHADLWAHIPAAAFLGLIIAYISAAFYTLADVLLVLRPRLTLRWKAGLIYFGDIAALDYEAWRQRMMVLAPAALADEVLEQVYATAHIAHRKHQYVRHAIRVLLVTVALGVALYAISQLVP